MVFALCGEGRVRNWCGNKPVVGFIRPAHHKLVVGDELVDIADDRHDVCPYQGEGIICGHRGRRNCVDHCEV